RLWQTQFEGNPSILGKSIKLNGVIFTVVGIAPDEFRGVFAGDTIGIWIPFMGAPDVYSLCLSRKCTFLNMIGRLKTGRTIKEAQAEMTTFASQLEIAYPDTNKGRGVILAPTRGVRPNLWAGLTQFVQLLTAGVIIVLLIVCANLAGLLLVRNM